VGPSTLSITDIMPLYIFSRTGTASVCEHYPYADVTRLLRDQVSDFRKPYLLVSFQSQGKLFNYRYVDHLSEMLHIFTSKNPRTRVQRIGGTAGYSQYESFQERIDNGQSYG
jgi:hypothetical protein